MHARTSTSHPLTFSFARHLSQDVEGDSDDDIPELEEQGGGEDSAEVRRWLSSDYDTELSS